VGFQTPIYHRRAAVSFIVSASFFALLSPSLAFSASTVDWQVLSGEEADKVLHQCSRGSPEGITGFWEINEKDINQMERVFSPCVPAEKLKTLADFQRQYIGFTRGTERYIYINAMKKPAATSANNDLSIGQVFCDGGSMFFGTEYKVSGPAFEKFAFNEGFDHQGAPEDFICVQSPEPSPQP
jgi:hypothetical protein